MLRVRLVVLGMSLGCAMASAQIAQKPTTEGGPRAALQQNYGKLPLSFEANQGQVDPQVRFTSRGNGYSLFLTDKEAVLALSKGSAPNAKSPIIANSRKTPAKGHIKTDVIRMQLAGAASGLKVAGEDRLAGTANYFIGNDPAKWHSNVPTYSKVKYAGVYPGVDLVYYGNQRQLEYDFVVAPGADPKQVKLRFAGAKKLKLNADGDLTVIAQNGEVAFHKPAVYQLKSDQMMEIGPRDSEWASQRVVVDGKFVLLAGNVVGFALENYDRKREVVIDPTLAYSTYLGGSSRAEAYGITVDSSGSAYLVGETQDSDFPVTAGAFQTVNNNPDGASNVFVSKLNPSGTALLFSTYLGGTGNNSGQGDTGTAIAVDAAGNSYLTGYTYSSDFPLMNPIQSVNKGAPNGLSDPFVSELNAAGSALVYSTYLGGSSSVYGYLQGDEGLGITVDGAGSAYVTGTTYSTDFPVTSGALQGVNNAQAVSSNNAFVTKIDPTGHSLVYSTYLGGSAIATSVPCCTEEGDGARGIVVDGAGNAYVVGQAGSSDFPVTPGAFQTANNGTKNGVDNGFIAKLNPTGTALVYASYLGGSSAYPTATCYFCANGDGIAAVAIDGLGDAFVAGGTYSSDFPVTSGAYQSTNYAAKAQTLTGFVSEVNPSGTALLYSTYLGGETYSSTGYGPKGDVAYGITLDSQGDAYVDGFTSSSDFPVTSEAYQAVNNGVSTGASNVFITELNPTGSGLLYSSYLGGGGNLLGLGDQANAIAIDSAFGVYLAGFSASANFPITTGALQTTNKALLGPYTLPTAFAAKFSFGSTSGAQPASALQFIPVTPCRVVDTRGAAGPFGGPELSAGMSREFDIPQSACGIPSTAVAYSLNVTVVPNASLSYLTLWPTGLSQPNVSTLNSDGRVKANAAITPAGTNGGVDVFVSDASQVILDIDGYFVPAGTASALSFYPVTPCRIADTRGDAGPLGGPSLAAGASRAFPIESSSCGLPSTALAYSLNVTAVPHSSLNYLTTWPTGQPQPNVSTLNASTGAVTANAAIVPAGTGGSASIFVSDDADVILDVNGYFAAPGTGGLSLYTVPPCRTLDTRPTAFNAAIAVNVLGSSCAPPATAQAYVLNATVVPQGPLVYLTLWPDGGTQPNVSTLNANDGAITSNMAIVPTSNGSIDAFADGTTNLLLDLASYFAP